MDHAFYVASKVPYQLNIHIRTPPYTNPVAGKLPYVAIGYKTNDPCPAAYLSMIKMVGDKDQHYSSKPSKKGYFEITKVADGWVEGIFALDIPESFSSDYKGALHITNGSFRFKIAAEWKN